MATKVVKATGEIRPSTRRRAVSAPVRPPPTDLSHPKVGTQVEDVFLLSGKTEGKTKSQKPFWSIELKNETGKIGAKIWAERYDQFAAIPCGSVLYVAGRIKEGYLGSAPEFEVVGDPTVVEGTHPLRALLNDRCETPLSDLVAEFDALLESIGHRGLRRFLDLFFSDPDGCPREKFIHAPAAVGHHHNYISGLLEHTLEVARIGRGIAQQPVIADCVHLDCLTAGIVVHDSGKIEEYEWEGVPIGISHIGKMRNHIALGYEMVSRIWLKHRRDLEALGMTTEHYDVIQAIILSHHGKLEHGALQEPNSMETLIAHLADMTSASTRKMVQAIRDSPPDERGWVLGNRHFWRGLFVLGAEEGTPAPLPLADVAGD